MLPTSFAPPVPAPVLQEASSRAPMISGKISTFRSPARIRSSGPSLLTAGPISAAPRKAAAPSPAPLSSSISPPKPLPPAPPPLTCFPRRVIPSPSTSTSTTSADPFSGSYVGNYSAQPALLDHRGQEETVKITVEIYLTASYGALIANPATSRSRSASALIPRLYDFWRDFHVQVYNGHQLLSPSDSGGHPLYRCGRFGPCRPRGAAIDLEFPAKAFASDSATIEVLPPQGEPISVDFDLTSLR